MSHQQLPVVYFYSTLACLLFAFVAIGTRAALLADAGGPAFAHQSCNTSFASLTALRLLNAGPLQHEDAVLDRSFAHCPGFCLSNSTGSSSAPVYGSFPYHSNSSLCLSAIHAGIITDRDGGFVFVSRFFRHDWSGREGETIFPSSSHRGTLSNGVQSLDVPTLWYSVPSGMSAHSWTVRGRGDKVVQRRSAPFSPRAGHSLVSHHIDASKWAFPFLAHLLVLVGGYNATHYLNDAWLAVSHIECHLPGCAADQMQRRDDQVPKDWQWFPLVEAPATFSPRADAQIHFDYRQDEATRSLHLEVFIVGGQVSAATNSHTHTHSSLS